MAGDKDVSTPTRAGGVASGGLSGLRTVWAGLRRRPLLTAAVVLVAAAVGATVWFVLPEPKLTGYVMFRIHSRPPHVLTPQESQDFNVYRQSQGTMVKDRDIVLNS